MIIYRCKECEMSKCTLENIDPFFDSPPAKDIQLFCPIFGKKMYWHLMVIYDQEVWEERLTKMTDPKKDCK